MRIKHAHIYFVIVLEYCRVLAPTDIILQKLQISGSEAAPIHSFIFEFCCVSLD